MIFEHKSVLLYETVDSLNIKPDGIYVDGNLGGGGHAYEVLKRLGPKGRLIGIDQDADAIQAASGRLKEYGEKVTIVRSNYRNIKEVLSSLGIEKVDGIYLDLGVSSYQLDTAERGFSYKTDGPLDLRLDSSRGMTAAERLKELDEEELVGMLVENSDEPYAKEIARRVMRELRNGNAVDTTTRLRELIEEALVFLPVADRKEAVKKSCQRCFQALRIDINSEFEVLYSFLDKLPGALKPGGRAAILTFHSGEDRLVKRAFKDGKKAGLYSEISADVIRPSAEECIKNGRARSTKLRWAIRG